MSVSVYYHFYCGIKNVPAENIFGHKFNTYEFSNYYDPAYDEESFSYFSQLLRTYMKEHNIKVGYCDFIIDSGGGYYLSRRYTFVNKTGKLITKKKVYYL